MFPSEGTNRRSPSSFKPPSISRPAERAIVRVPIDNICPNPYQPRRHFSNDSVAELAASIQLHGLLSPLLVRSLGGGKYELIAGERRLRALRQLERPFAEVIILAAADCDCALIALVENLQREGLHFLDEAEACRRILNEYSITQERLAASLSYSPSALANRLRLLKLPARVQSEIRLHNLSERHARALLKLDTEADQLAMAVQAAEQHLSVKQLEARIEQTLRRPPLRARQQVSRIVRDNRIIINAVLDTVRELSRIGVQVKSRVEEREDHIDVVVTIPACAPVRSSAGESVDSGSPSLSPMRTS